MIKMRDLAWALAYPFYQLVGTLRHEAAHALVARLEGARIQRFVWWPTFRGSGRVRWGYVAWQGETSWLAIAAPYLLDLLTFGVAYLVCARGLIRCRWLWVNVVILGIVSPLVNSAYNYWGGFGSVNDVGQLLRALPPAVVHGYFAATLALYLVGFGMVWAYIPGGQSDR